MAKSLEFIQGAGRSFTSSRRSGFASRFYCSTLTSIDLDPSFATATALVADSQRVRPYGYDGRPLGHAVRLDEHARVELHRVNRSLRFVVWKVSPTK